MRTSAPSRSAQFAVPRDVRVVAEDGAVLLEVERLALREVLLRGDVEEDDVAELLVRAEARELAADVACSDETDLLAGGHGRSSWVTGAGLAQRCGYGRARSIAKAEPAAPAGDHATVCVGSRRRSPREVAARETVGAAGASAAPAEADARRRASARPASRRACGARRTAASALGDAQARGRAGVRPPATVRSPPPRRPRRRGNGTWISRACADYESGASATRRELGPRACVTYAASGVRMVTQRDVGAPTPRECGGA